MALTIICEFNLPRPAPHLPPHHRNLRLKMHVSFTLEGRACGLAMIRNANEPRGAMAVPQVDTGGWTC